MRCPSLLISLMSKTVVIILISVLCIIALSQPAEAFTWAEIEDAGELPETAQDITNITKNEPLEFITGHLESPTDVDMYAIFVTGGGDFSATTVGWTIDVDTQLTLFDSTGIGVYSNDDFATANRQSTLPAFNMLTPTAPGIYYLAISDFDYDPVSGEGYIFPHPDSIGSDTDVNGPTGPGGASPITGWDGISTFGGGSYTIALTGAVAVARLPKNSNIPAMLMLLLSD